MNPQPDSPPNSGKHHRGWAMLAVFAILCAYAAQVTLASRALSPTWNEPYHLIAGYSYWLRADYGVNPEHPPLAKLIAAFPLLFMHLNAPLLGRDDSKGTANRHGADFLAQNDGARMLVRGRLTESILGLLLLLLIAEAGYRMFGPEVGWVALILAAFEPNLIGHSALVTTDVAFTLFYLASIYALWKAAEQPTLSRFIACGLMTGFALASKHSALALLPVLALLTLVEVVSQQRTIKQSNPAASPPLYKSLRAWSGRLLLIYGIAFIVLWGFYGFRFQARPDRLPLWASFDGYAHLLKGHLTPWALITAAHLKLLPQAYLFGLVDVLIVTHGPRASFLLGHLHPHAVWYYFPTAFIIKSTLGFLALLAIGLVGVKGWAGEHFRRAAYILIPPALFLGATLTAGTNLGVRHILPIYPFLILAAAAGAVQAARNGKVGVIVVIALLTLHVVSSIRALPNDLAYSNELFGGTSNTYRSLSDSNADWGQGLIEARAYLAQHNIQDCWFGYIGTVDVSPYHLPCKMLPNPFMKHQEIIPPAKYHGVVLVGGTNLAGSYFGGGVLNPYADFMKLKPSANLGGAVLVYAGDFDLSRAAAVAHMTKAWELFGVKDQEGAIQEAVKASDLAPDHPGPPYFVGFILAQEKRTGAARAQFEESLRRAEEGDPAFMSTWVKSNKEQLDHLPQ
jgi:hypothetical protein